MDSDYIKTLSYDEKIIFIKIFCKLVRADGNIDAGEISFLKDIAARYGIDNNTVVSIIKNQNFDYIAEARKIAGERLVIGVSAHNVEEALLAEKNGADYLGSGAVFGSQTKSNVHTLPLETLKNICSSVKIPVVAIGGINKDNILQLSGSGINGAALVSAIFGATDIETECRMLKKLAEHAFI